MRTFLFLVSSFLTVMFLSGCGGGSGNGDPSPATQTINTTFYCLETNFSPEIDADTIEAECVSNGSATLTLGSTYTIAITESIAGTQANASGDIVTVTSVGNKGYFSGVSSTHSTTVTLDSNGMGHVTYVQNTTATAQVTLTSSLMANSGNSQEAGLATSTLIFTTP
jgi:hypothetical protein